MITKASPQEMADGWVECDDALGVLSQRQTQLDRERSEVIERKKRNTEALMDAVGQNVPVKVYVVRQGAGVVIVEFKNGVRFQTVEKESR